MMRKLLSKIKSFPKSLLRKNFFIFPRRLKNKFYDFFLFHLLRPMEDDKNQVSSENKTEKNDSISEG